MPVAGNGLLSMHYPRNEQPQAKIKIIGIFWENPTFCGSMDRGGYIISEHRQEHILT